MQATLYSAPTTPPPGRAPVVREFGLRRRLPIVVRRTSSGDHRQRADSFIMRESDVVTLELKTLDGGQNSAL